ncbi:hypothetical protein CEXT_803961 [Caerostris extrusa]|uniref:Uncharacterized protein n=1 Tax=Caerostris extrusa TaxID=172846 RepID=A0AAV4Y1R6_CAEEX|nr:hypothetical protein CEXT_803961 [Caerostris extrusa]
MGRIVAKKLPILKPQGWPALKPQGSNETHPCRTKVKKHPPVRPLIQFPQPFMTPFITEPASVSADNLYNTCCITRFDRSVAWHAGCNTQS